MTATDPLDTLIVYRRHDCSLCDEAEMMLADELERRSADGLPTPSVIRIDIAEDPELTATYRVRIPVFAFRGHEEDLVVTPRQVRAVLERGLVGP